MPFVAIALAFGGVFASFQFYGANNNGVEFFVATEPERAIVYVRARGNRSLSERDRLLAAVEKRVMTVPGIESVFAFAGQGGLDRGAGQGPKDSVGQVQIELAPWGARRPGAEILADVEAAIEGYPGVISEIQQQQDGPQQGKPIQLRLKSDDWQTLLDAAEIARDHFMSVEGLAESGRSDALRAAFAHRNALQCGYCTPGMLASALAYIEGGGSADRDAIRAYLSGNYCRCTGYQSIVDAVCDVVEGRAGA